MSTGSGETTPQVNSLQDLKPKQEMRGKVKKIELYGAFVDLGIGTDGLLHISQLSTERVKNVSDVVKEGDEVTVWVRNVDVDQRRIDLTMVQPAEKNFNEVQQGQVLSGTVVRVEKFGAFVDVGAERPGMVHVSELTNGYVSSPSEVVKVGQEVQVRVIKVNNKKKQIDLSMKALEEPVEMPQEEDNEEMPTAMELALRRAMQGTDMAADFVPSKQQKPKREKRSDKRRQQQDEILQRTLQNRVK
jgi:small subunit ribosomal protein S1